MSLFDNFVEIIKGAVGNNMDNDQEDVLKVTTVLPQRKTGQFRNALKMR